MTWLFQYPKNLDSFKKIWPGVESANEAGGIYDINMTLSRVTRAPLA